MPSTTIINSETFQNSIKSMQLRTLQYFLSNWVSAFVELEGLMLQLASSVYSGNSIKHCRNTARQPTYS
jgi:hypothetical protein